MGIRLIHDVDTIVEKRANCANIQFTFNRGEGLLDSKDFVVGTSANKVHPNSTLFARKMYLVQTLCPFCSVKGD